MHGDYVFRIFTDGANYTRLVRVLLCYWFSTLLAFTTNTAIAQELAPEAKLTESAAIEYALERPAFRQTEEARIGIAGSVVLEKSLLPNPVVSIDYDNAAVPSGRARDSSVMVSQAFDISGRRALGKEAAQTRLQAAQFDVKSLQLKTIVDVRRTFADSLYRQQQMDAHKIWLNRIKSITETVSRLAGGGEASGYDRRRLEREVQIAQTKLNASEADAIRSRGLLAGLIARPISESDKLEGNLIPDAPPTFEKLTSIIERHPDLASLEAQATAFERDRQAANRLKTPDVTLGIGAKHVQEPGFSDHGLMLSMSLPIPVFNYGQAQEQQAKSQAMMVQAERSLKLSRAQAELSGIWSQTTQLREAALSFQNDSATASQELSHIAEASYRAGEGSLLELLDAYRSELEANAIKLDLSLRARLSRIELDALTGVTQYE
jgi:cobalt-zinc-cadmium efflux system outer membrane protein